MSTPTMVLPFFLVIITLSACVADDRKPSKTFNILSLLPFTTNGHDSPYDLLSNPANSLGFSHMIASLLAVDQFNKRNATIVPEIADIVGCDYSMRITFSDNQESGAGALADVLHQVYNGSVLDAIVGGFNDDIAVQLNVIGTSLQIPAISYGGLVVTSQVSLFGKRMSPDSSEMGKVVASYLSYRKRSNYIGFLYASSETALQVLAAIFDQSEMKGVLTAQEHYQPSSHTVSGANTSQAMVDALRKLRDTGFRTIVLIVDDYATEIPIISQAAATLGMTSDNKCFWLVAGDIDLDFFTYISSTLPQYQSVVDLLRGGVTIRPLDGFMVNPASDKFMAAWKDNDGNFFMNQSIVSNPIKMGDPGYFAAGDGYLKAVNPNAGGSFIFDAIMSLGLGLCKCGTSHGTTLLSAIEGLHFDGASGIVEFESSGELPGGRVGQTVSFGAFNLFPSEKSNVVLTDILDGVPSTSTRASWRPVAAFTFPDGSSDEHLMLRDPSMLNYLSAASRIWGFTLFSVSMLSCILSVLWVYWNRKHRKVKASQPFFLYCVAFGAFLISFAIVVNSFDEGRGWSILRLSEACTASPWVVVCGILAIYSALFSKLWRVNIVMQFRRKAVTVQSVIWPAAILTSAALILMTVWTVLEGFHWVRQVIDPISGASFGKCQGKHTVAYFTPIFLLICIPVFFTAIMAYKTKDVDAAFSEGSWIFALIAVHIQFLLISIPLLRTLEESSTNTRYVGQATIFFAFSMSTLLLIIGPKVFSVYTRRGVRDTIRASGCGSVRVSGFHPTSSYVVPSTSEPVVAQPESAMPRIEEGNEAERCRHIQKHEPDGNGLPPTAGEQRVSISSSSNGEVDSLASMTSE